MKQLQLILCLLLLLLFDHTPLRAQSPRFEKYQIQQTGAYVFLPAEPIWELTFSADESSVLTTEVQADSISYGVIMILLADSLGQDKDELLLAYLNYLNENAFELTSENDPVFERRLSSSATARGILIIGEDAAGQQYAVKGWINDTILSVLYIHSHKELNEKISNMFLNGFIFPSE